MNPEDLNEILGTMAAIAAAIIGIIGIFVYIIF